MYFYRFLFSFSAEQGMLGARFLRLFCRLTRASERKYWKLETIKL